MKRTHIYLYLLLLLQSLGCNSTHKEYATYNIKRGRHHCDQRKPTLWNKNEIQFLVKFDSTCIYAIDSIDQADVNKLIGIADNAFQPSKNSARLGWRYDLQKQKIEVLTYTHQNRKFDFTPICYVDINKEYNCSITLNDKYTFKVNDNTIEQSRSSKQKHFHCLLFFYFGGNQNAPHDISVQIKIL